MIKRLFYLVFALFFNFYAAVFKLHSSRVALVSMHNEGFNDSLGEIRRALEARGGFEIVTLSKLELSPGKKGVFAPFRFFVYKSFLLATSKYVFLNDNFLPLSMCRPKKAAVYVQLWHGEGVFKRFGLDVGRESALRKSEIQANKRLAFVVCTSRGVLPYYASAFGVERSKVLPLGSARVDMLFDEERAAKARERFFSRYPSLRGKRLVLYAPTFREGAPQDMAERIDMGLFAAELGENARLLLRLHPQIHPQSRRADGAVDCTDYDDVRDLALVCDALITDYSSICMLFLLLGKKTVFYAYDLDDYTARRDFYFNYKDYIPSDPAKTFAEAVERLKEPDDEGEIRRFVSFNFDFADKNSAERIIDAVIFGES